MNHELDIMTQLSIVASECSSEVQRWLMYVCLAALGVMAVFLALRKFLIVFTPMLVWCKSHRLEAVFVAPFVLCMVWYGATKEGAKGTITYPFTDPEIRYIRDNGSYVTNDFVHIAFTTMIVPSTADLQIWRRRLDQTNDLDFVCHTNTTIGAFNQPQDIQFPAATNWNWQVFTTWTPGPSVLTNGVWHAYWGIDRKKRMYPIPIRTCVRLVETNGTQTVIATPKSKEDNNQ